VYAAARQQLQAPGNRVDRPVEWVRTTFGVFEKVSRSGIEPGKAAVPVYVIELHGSFLFTGSPGPGPEVTSGTPSGPLRTAVVGIVLPIGPDIPGTNGGWESDASTDLSAMGAVHTFVL
jgi:hypothetical protein